MRGLALVGVLAVACSPPLSLPAPPELEGFAVGVLGWEGTRATAILDIDDLVVSSSTNVSLHWLGLPQNPRLLFPDNDNVIKLTRNGVRLHPSEVFRLNDTPAGPDWSEDPNFDPLLWGWKSSRDLAFCSLGRSCVSGGVCSGATCFADGPEAPEPPKAGCPTGWRDIGEEDGDTLCFPEEWVVGNTLSVPSVNLNCDIGEMHLGDGCEAMSACSASFGPVPVDAENVVYVDASAAPGGDGTRDSPYNAIEPALVNGSTIMLAEGVYSRTQVSSAKPAHIIGTCAAKVQLEFNLRFDGANVSLRNVGLSRGHRLMAIDSVLEIDGVQFLDEAPVVLRDSLVTMNRSNLGGRALSGTALTVEGGHFRVANSVLGRSSIRGATAGFENVRVINEGPSNVVVMSDSSVNFSEVEIFGQGGFGLFVAASTSSADHRIVLEDSRIVSGQGVLHEEGLTTVELSRVGIVAQDGQGFQAASSGVRQFGSALVASEVSVVGFNSGINIESARNAGDQTRRGSVKLDWAWVGWSGQFGLRTGRSIAGGELRDVFFSALTSSPPFQDRLGADDRAIVLASGVWTVDRLRLRPRGRNAIEVQDRVTLELADVEVVGPHGRSLALQIGSSTEVTRFEAVGGSDGITIASQVGELGSLLVRDIRLKFRPNDSRAGFSLALGPASIGFESFSFDGIRFVSHTGDIGLTDGAIGFTDDATWTDEFRNSLTNVFVYKQEELQ